MVPELLLLVGQGSERFFSSENKTKQKNPGSNVKSLLNLFGADDLSNWNGFWKQSWELGWGMGHLLLGETRKNRDRSLTRRRMEGSLPAGNMVPINKTLFSSILLKSHKTSEDFTANCQVTLQTVRSRITKKKKKNRLFFRNWNSSTKHPLRTKRPMVWFVQLHHPYDPGPGDHFCCAAIEKPVGGAKLHNTAFKG